MHRLPVAGVCVALLAGSARADILLPGEDPNEPCRHSERGTACQLKDGKPGVCDPYCVDKATSVLIHQCDKAADGAGCTLLPDRGAGKCLHHRCEVPVRWQLDQECGGKIAGSACHRPDGASGACLQDPYRCIERVVFEKDSAQCKGQYHAACTTLDGAAGTCRSAFECEPQPRRPSPMRDGGQGRLWGGLFSLVFAAALWRRVR